MSFVVLIAVPVIARYWFGSPPAIAMPEQPAISQAVAAVPYRISTWVGRDIDLPQAAVQLLRPTAMLARRYVEIESGERVDLLVVHCNDSRDMLGHYPPVCYPAIGWVLRADPTRVELPVGNHTTPAGVYEFMRPRVAGSAQRGGVDESIRVFNFFMVPGGPMAGDIDTVSQRTRWTGSSAQGVSQVQVVTGGYMPIAQAMHAAGQILTGIVPLMETLGVNYGEQPPY